MKKVTEKEFNLDAKRSVCKAVDSPIIKEINKLKVLDIVFVSIKEWNKYFSPYSSPSTRISQIFRRSHNSKKKFTTRATRDETGWMIRRIK